MVIRPLPGRAKVAQTPGSARVKDGKINPRPTGVFL